MTDENRPEAQEEPLIETPEAEIEDPIGDETDGEAGPAIESEEDIEDAEDEAEEEAEDEPEIESEEDGETDEDASDVIDETAEEEQDEPDQDEPEFKPKPRPPAKLERLQKILAQSGVASRRKAEEMIEQGRVQVNGKTVTELGTKADAGRDHIRVDGKLLQGAERLRYFVLNKPRGFVTTVKDPEGRPTVMQFFDKMRERLYPVGRLDYLSEGLLLVTNDGELANKLTRAAAGVEKTYLVKVAGIPSEDELDVLRAGVAIEKGKPGSGKVRTSPARIRQVRQGDNPWYEVVLIEGRNRELRKMFEEIGHFVEKIRRVGYGPLVLDQEPGNLRELDAQELELLRKAADGKLRTPKSKDIRRRNIIDSLPPEKPAFKARGGRAASERPAAGPKDYQPKKSFGTDRPARSGPGKTGPGQTGSVRPGSGPARFGAGAPRPAWKKDGPPARFTPQEGSGSERPGSERTESRPRPSAGRTYGDRPAGRTFGGKPPAGRPFGDKPAPRAYGDKPAGRSYGAKPGAGRPGSKPFGDKPAWKKPEAGDRPAFKRPTGPKPEATRRPAPEPSDDEPRKQFKIHIEPVQDFDRSENTRGTGARPSRPSTGRPPFGRSGSGRPGSDRSGSDRPASSRPSSGRPSTGRSGPPRTEGGRSSSSRPFRSEGGLPRAFTTSSGKPRPGGARPSSKPGKDGGRSYGPPAGRGAGSGSGPAKRPFTPRTEGAGGFRPRSDESGPEHRTGTGWKPKPAFGGKAGFGAKPGFKPKPGGAPKSGSKGSSYKSKPSGAGGAKRSGPRPGGKKPGGKRSY
jgi:23S rRNA pseudouridine2605 synthase